MRQWMRAVASVFAAFLGVQSEANRRRDFTQGRFSVFVVHLWAHTQFRGEKQ